MSRQSACDLLVRGGTVVAADGTRATNVAVRDGLIVGIGGATLPAKRVIDATGLLVLPGVIDAHTHLNSEWPFPDERRPADDFASGTRGAAAGGITTVCDFVYALGDESLLQATNRVCAAAAAGAHVDVALHVAVTTFRETVLHELGDLVGAGFTSFKFYTSLPDFQARAADLPPGPREARQPRRRGHVPLRRCSHHRISAARFAQIAPYFTPVLCRLQACRS